MIDAGFLLCWTVLFLGTGILVRRFLVNRIRMYLLLLLNLIFLTTLFWLYPLVLTVSQ
jgi:hypothetical protein